MGTIRQNERKMLVTGVVCYVLFLSATVLAQTAEYEYVEILSSREGFEHIYPQGVNNSGVVIGSTWKSDVWNTWWWPSRPDPNTRGFMLSQGDFKKLLLPGSTYTSIYAINDDGTVVGVERLLHIPVIWTKYLTLGEKFFIYAGGKYTILHPPPGYSFVEPYDINNNGTVIGCISTGAGPFSCFKAFIYIEGKYVELIPEGCLSSSAIAINNSDAVVVWGIDAYGQQKLFIYDDGNYTMMIPPEGLSEKTVIGIDDNGIVFGYGMDISSTDRGEVGFICEGETCTEMAPILPADWWPSTPVVPYHISANGKVIGGMGDNIYDADGRADWFIYSGGEYQFLKSPPGLYGPHVTGINDNGLVVGYAQDRELDDPDRRYVGFMAKINRGDSD